MLPNTDPFCFTYHRLHDIFSFDLQSWYRVYFLPRAPDWCGEGPLLCQLSCSSFLHTFGHQSSHLSIKVHITVKECTLGLKGGGRKQGGKVNLSGNGGLGPKWPVLKQKCL